MKVVFYAINGLGLGHLSRCQAIARKLRTLGQMLGEPMDISFLTTSDADWVVQGFPVYKFPSKSVFQGQPGAAKRYVSGAKLMLSNMMAWLRPDVLVVDTQSQGAFAEFHFLRDYARHCVLIERHKLSDQAESAIHQSHLKLYDEVLVPDDEDQGARYHFPVEVSPRFVGRVCGYDENEAWEPQRVRDHFGLRNGQRLVYVAAGGGGDPAAAEERRALVTQLRAIPEVVVLTAMGPLSLEEGLYSLERVHSVREPGIWRYFRGVDLALSAAGYNSYEELLAAGVPSLFYPQVRGLDDQDGRIAIGEEAGWHGRLDRERVVDQVRAVLDGTEIIDGSLAERRPAQGALQAAGRIFEQGLVEVPLETRLILEAAEIALEQGRAAGFAEWLTWQKRFAARKRFGEQLLEIRELSLGGCGPPPWFLEAMDWGATVASWRARLERPGELDTVARRLAKHWSAQAVTLFHDLAVIVMGGTEMGEILEITADPKIDLSGWIALKSEGSER